MRSTVFLLIKVVATVAVMACLTLAINTVIKALGAHQEEERNARIQAASAAVIGLVKTFRHQQAQSGLEPTVVWEGADADVLLVDQVLAYSVKGTRPTWAVLARTANGRFFRVQYVLEPDAACEQITECLATGRFEALSLDEAKAHVFAARKSELYEKLFGEKMPPAEVKA